MLSQGIWSSWSTEACVVGSWRDVKNDSSVDVLAEKRCNVLVSVSLLAPRRWNWKEIKKLFPRDSDVAKRFRKNDRAGVKALKSDET